MKKQLNIKQLRKNMTFLEIVKIIFKDKGIQCDSSGSKRLLTSQEEEDLVQEVRDRGMIPQLNSLNRFFNSSSFLCFDLQHASLALLFTVERLQQFVAAVRHNNSFHEFCERVLYGLGGSNSKVREEVESFGKACEEGAFRFFVKGAFIPSMQMETIIEDIFQAFKKVKKNLFLADFLNKKAGFDLFSENEREVVVLAQEQLKEISAMEGAFKVLGVYKVCIDHGVFMDQSSIVYRLLVDPSNELALTCTEKEEIIRDVNKYLPPSPIT